ncbi:hypothetical protein Egran_05099 [Elaphomyces granulatus]|uniref:Uncharacterized protein n=1 Tax=Elaphomyces granulatus TaxID=519963 RepID=A0A232LSN1_9EURO|nr:hypothetical protein Egran_05099 [Elaphomyces granulatus]
MATATLVPFPPSGDTNGFLDAVRARVEAGGGELGMEKAKHLLKKYEALPRPKKPAEMRIETLENLMKDPSRKKDVINISAVIKAYEDEQIKYLPGYFYLFCSEKNLLPAFTQTIYADPTASNHHFVTRWKCVNFGLEDLIHEIYTVGPNFKQASNFLWPFKLSNRFRTRKFKRFVEGGDTGNREDNINALIRQMN